jgi:hypothetical protein
VKTSSPPPAALTRKVTTSSKQNLGGKGTLKQLSAEPKAKTNRAFRADQFYNFITGEARQLAGIIQQRQASIQPLNLLQCKRG